MDKLIKTALMMLAEMRLAQSVSRYSGAAKWLALAGFCGLGACGALVAALWLFLIPRIGADGAALSVGAILAGLCGLFVLVARATLHPNRTPQAALGGDDDSLGDLRELFTRHKGTALLSAIVAGIVLASGRK
jgi:hypothetical protein